MLRRLRLGLLVLSAFAFLSVVRATTQVEDDEANRLYTWANSYVNNVTEGDYTYAYIQFYWKRAESYIERIQRVYPTTPTGKALVAGRLNLGPYTPAYFRDRVLYRLEEKHVAADNGINCSIFLYTRDENRWDNLRREALVRILENLSRQKRFSEAIRFEPVIAADRPLRWYTIYRIACLYEQADVIKDMTRVAPPAYQETLAAIRGKAMAVRGLDRKALQKLIADHPTDTVKEAVLDGMIERETAIRRAAALKLPIQVIELEGDSVKRPEVRDDVESTARQFFPTDASAHGLLEAYHAGLGAKPSAGAGLEAQQAYMDYLALSERFADLKAYPDEPGLGDETKTGVTRYAIELLAKNARLPDAQALVARLGPAGTQQAELAQLSLFRGQMNSTADPLIVHPDTFVSLPIQDPCILAIAIMEWSLTPTRATRGSSPWDGVVGKYEPGFQNIPESKSADVKKASQSVSPF